MTSEERTSQPHQRSSASRMESLSQARPDASFDRFARLAARLLAAPYSLVSFVDGHGVQVRGMHGVPGGDSIHEDDLRDHSLCQHVIHTIEPLIVSDTGKSDLAQASWLVERTGTRSYLGIPLTLSGNVAIGVLSVSDIEPREWTEDEIVALSDLSAIILDEIERRRPETLIDHERLEEERDRHQRDRLLEAIGDGVFAVDTDGVCHYINRAGANMLGYEPDELLGQRIHETVHHSYPDGTPMPRSECTVVQATIAGVATFISEHVFWRKDGTSVRVELTASPVTEFGTVTGTVIRFSNLSEREHQQEQLRASELRKRAMFESALDAIITVDHEGRVLEFNAAAERTFGYARDDVTGRRLAELIDPAGDDQHFLEAFAELLHSGFSEITGDRIERPARRADGTIIQTEMTVTRVDIPEHAEPLFTVFVRDITEYKEAEEKVTAFRHMVDAVGQAVIANDNSPERRITYWNRAAEEILGWKAEEVLGKGFYDLVPDSSFSETVREVGQQVRNGQNWQGEFRMRHKNGTVIPALAMVSPIFNEKNELLGVVSCYADLTQIKETEREIRLYKHIVDAVGESVVASDMDRKIFYANRAAEEALGWSIDDVRGLDVRDVVPADGFRDLSSRVGEEVRETAERWSGEFVLRRTSGETFPALVTLAPISGDSEELVGTIGIYTDISELKRTERDLRFHKHAFDAVGQAVVAADRDRKINYWNEAAEELLGWRKEEVLGRPFLETVPAEFFAEDADEIGRQVRDGRVWDGEYFLQHRDGTVIHSLSSVRAVIDEQGELIGVIGAHSDIRELKEAEREIRLYKHLTDAVGQALVATDRERRITYWNRAAEEILGWTAEEVLGEQFDDVVPMPAFQSAVHTISDQVRSGESWQGEFELRHKSGTRVPALATVSPIINDDGELLGVVGAYADLTEIKETEEDLLFHKSVVSTVAQPIVANDRYGRVTYFNKAAEDLLGWSRDEVLGRLWVSFGPADEVRDDVRGISQHVRSGKSWSGESGLKHKDGSLIPVLKQISPVLDEDGNLVQIIAAYTDISEIKRREQDIHFFKHVVDAIGEAVVATSLDGDITYVNSAAEQMLGWRTEEIVGHRLLTLIPDQTFIDHAQEIAALVRSGTPWFGEFPLRRKDGSSFPALVSIAPMADETGEIAGIISVYSEISDLKDAERENRFFKHVVDAVGQIVIANDLDRKITYWNQAAEEILGWKAEEVLGVDAAMVAPKREFLPRIPEISSIVRNGGTWLGEFPLQRRDGSDVQALSALRPIFDENGETIGVLGVHTDIRELKLTEQELRFHKHIVDAVGQAVVVSDTEGRIIYWNKAAEDIYGWTADEALGSIVHELLSAPDVVPQSEQVTNSVASGETWSGESQVRHKSGVTFPAYFTVSPIRDSVGEIVGIIGVSHDISDQKEYERQIEFHKIMLDAVGQTIVTTDSNRVITFWSKGAEQQLGWTAEEVIGRPIADIAPAAHLKDQAGELHRTVREGKTWVGEFPIRRKDGSTFPAVVSLAPVTLADRGTVGVIGVYTDVTELKQTEEELRLHKHMLDAVGQAVCATDENLRVTYWNRSAEELYGYAAAEAIGLKLLDFIPPDSTARAQVVEAIEAVSLQGDWTGEMTTYHQDGSEVSALVSASPILSEHGQQVGLIVAMADITARRRVEEALKESNDQNIEILETMGDGFISLNRDWRIQYVNKQAEVTLNRDRHDLLGRDFWDEFPDPEGLPFFRKFEEAFESGKSIDITEYDPFLDMWLEVHVSPSAGRLSVFFRDVTERRAREIALREAEERYRTLVEQLPAMTYLAHPDDPSKLIYISPQIERMIGYSPSEWLGDPTQWIDRVHPDDRDHVQEADARTIREQHENFRLEYRVQGRDGAYRWLRDTATLIRDIDGQPSYWQGISYDVTREKQAERAIQENEQRFRSLFENHPDAVFSIDHTGHVLSANPAFENLTGQSSNQKVPLQFVDLVVSDDRDRVLERFAETHAGLPQDFRTGIYDPLGRRIDLNLTTIPIVVDEGIVGVHVVAQDVTIHRQLEERLAHQAYHDSLTGLPNRSLFQSRLVDRLEAARASGDMFAVLFFDLDDFKVINDSLGHSAGDQLLIEVSRRVQTCIRTRDLLARLGGDEFTLLLDSVETQEDAILIAERIAAVLDDAFNVDDHEVFATTSVGIALGDATSPSADDILRNADLAMYEAKNSGKDRYALFEPSMNSRAWLRLTLESEIRQGITRKEFRVHYQPIVDLATGEIEGVEALVRWQHPEHGLLSPRDFISVAEQSGLILPLGRWIVHEATTQLRTWQEQFHHARPMRLSLNLSPRQYQHPRLVEELTRTLRNVQFDPGLITLEITENIAMDDSPNTIDTLQQLKDVGVQLALDDFGTGFSALSYLRRFPIDIIKIDQSFVDGLGIDPEDSSIVRAVMAASHAMRLTVTAEGVETIAQLRILRELGCHLGQGFLFSRALSAGEMSRLLADGVPVWRSLIAEADNSEESELGETFPGA